jgi:hypothetical protein
MGAAVAAAAVLLGGCIPFPRPTVTVTAPAETETDTDVIEIETPEITPEAEPEPEPSTEPTEEAEPEVNTETSGDVAAPGSEFKIGETAILPYTTAINRKDQNIEVTVIGIRKGSQDDFASLNAKSQKQLADVVPYYVELTIKKGSPDVDELAYNSVSSSQIGALDQDGDRVSPLLIFGTFEPCDSPSFGKEIDQGETATLCVPFAGSSAMEVTSVTWHDYDSPYSTSDGKPVVWS